ncbi:MAG: hypothetical protein GY756_00660 [bacterium]|nr:hypothetical protein [bacterium]
MITNIKHQKLRNSEFAQYHFDISEITGKFDTEALAIHSKFEVYREKANPLLEHFNDSKKSKFSSLLGQTDDERDDALNGIIGIIESYTKHYDPLIKAAAKLLLEKINSYGKGISRLNYQAETLTITSIVKDLRENEEFVNAIALLGLSDWLDYLEERNNKFTEYDLQRVDEAVELSHEKTVQFRSEAMTAYKELTELIKAHVTINGIADYEKLIQKINTKTEQYNLIITKRSTESDSEEE